MSRVPPPASIRVVVAVLVTVTTAAVCLASCGEIPPVTPPASTTRPTLDQSSVRLHVLIGRPGAMHLLAESWPGGAGTVAPDVVEVPGPVAASGDVRWASGDGTRGFVVSVGAAGRLYVRDPAPAGSSPPWREIEVKAAPGSKPVGPSSLSVLSQDGRRIAAMTGDPASGVADARLLVIERATGSARVIPLGGIVDGRPPAWIGATRVAIPLRDRLDAHLTAIVDTTAASVTRLPGTGVDVTVSGNGASVVTTGPGPVDGVATGSAEAFLAGRQADVLPLDVGAHPVAAQVLLDVTGSTLAVAWLADNGDTAAVTVYRREGSAWAHLFDVPWPHDATRAVLAGFDP